MTASGVAYPMARAAGDRVQNPLLREYNGIADNAISKSGQPNFRNETSHIRLALLILRDPKFNDVKALPPAKNTRAILEGISSITAAEVNDLTDEQAATELRLLTAPAVANLNPGEARVALDLLRTQDSTPQSLAPSTQGWIEWAVTMVISAATCVSGSAAHLLQNAASWTPAYRQTVIASLEAQVVTEEKKG